MTSDVVKKPSRFAPKVFWLAIPLVESSEIENIRSDAVVSVKPQRYEVPVGGGRLGKTWEIGCVIGLATGVIIEARVTQSQVMRALASPMLWDESAGVPVVDVSCL